MNKYILSLLLLCGIIIPSRAEWNDSIRYRAEIGMTFAGGENTPFMLTSSRYGLASNRKNNAYLRLSAFKDMDTTRRFTWGAGIDLALTARMTSRFMAEQLYAEAKYRCLNLMVGSKEIPGYISDPELSSGNLLYGNNAMPIPQVRAGIFDYADVWGCRGWFGVKGYISFGKYMDNRWIRSWVDASESKYTTGTYYHSKALFIHLGNRRKFPLEYEMGIEMATQFGGATYYLNGTVDKLPGGIKSFWKALVPLHGSDENLPGEMTNVEGNFLGAWNFALSWHPQADWSLKLYYQHFFEDHSMLWIQYPWKDGLYGVQARLPKNRWVSDVVYEFIYSKDQAGPVFWDKDDKIPEQASGRDTYFNHYIYNGWQNFGMGIGNPLYISPIYNNPHIFWFRSNRFWAHHIGLKGQPSETVGYRLISSFQKSWGSYADPFPETETNFALMAELNIKPRKLPGWQIDLSLALDHGKLVGNNYGAMIRISKTGWLFGKK